MALDELRSVIAAEEQADAKLAAAYIEIKKILTEAETQGRQLIFSAEAEAEEAVKILMAEADLKATENALIIAARTSEECQILRTAMQKKIPKAVKRLVERIVNG